MPWEGRRKSDSLTVLEEYKALRGALYSLSNLLGCSEEPYEIFEWEKETDNYLLELREHLTNLFRLEEGPQGFYKEILDHLPHKERHLEKLRAEHTTGLKRVEALIARLRYAEDRDYPSLHRGFCSLVAFLREHEGKEDRLFQQTFCRDEGAGD